MLGLVQAGGRHRAQDRVVFGERERAAAHVDRPV
jgi:hypothetical protein